jgi:translation elongation factor EF-Tu-like GTPase
MTDTVLLSFPRDARYYAVARLVVGGMAAPLELSYDALDDVQLALTSMLDHEELAPAGVEADTLADVQLRLSIEPDRLVAALGSFVPGSIDRAFERSTKQGGELGLRRMLDTIVDGVEVDTLTIDDGPAGEWITLTKRLGARV